MLRGMGKLKSVKIGLLGLGTVGAGVANLISSNKEVFKDKYDIDLSITHAVVNDVNKNRDVCDKSLSIHDNVQQLLTDPDIDIVVELIGGVDKAYEYVKDAISNGKAVVTANKALIATHGKELFDIAKDNKTVVLYEASVAGGIPIIKVLREGLASNNILSLHGILNGTSNYILTKMSNDKISYNSALKLAQEKGYAESDATYDVEGMDAQYKLSILASIGYGIPLSIENIYREGISDIEPFDIDSANSLGYVLKHLCIGELLENNKLLLRVHPALLKKEHILANIDGVTNAVNIKGDNVGDTLYSGPGAGAMPTASAVVSDILDISRMIPNYDSIVAPLSFKRLRDDVETLDIKELKTSYYLRFYAQDTSGVLAKITKILAENNISVETFVQDSSVKNDSGMPLVLLTHPSKELDIKKAIDDLEGLNEVRSSVKLIRVEV